MRRHLAQTVRTLVRLLVLVELRLLLLVRLLLIVLVTVALMVMLVVQMQVDTLSGHGALVRSREHRCLGREPVLCHHSPFRRCSRRMVLAAAAYAPSCPKLQSRCWCIR